MAFGEVGLAGEVRPAPRGQERLREAAKLGFSMALIPKQNAPKQAIEGLEVIAVDRVEHALARVRGGLRASSERTVRAARPLRTRSFERRWIVGLGPVPRDNEARPSLFDWRAMQVGHGGKRRAPVRNRAGIERRRQSQIFSQLLRRLPGKHLRAIRLRAARSS